MNKVAQRGKQSMEQIAIYRMGELVTSCSSDKEQYYLRNLGILNNKSLKSSKLRISKWGWNSGPVGKVPASGTCGLWTWSPVPHMEAGPGRHLWSQDWGDRDRRKLGAHWPVGWAKLVCPRSLWDRASKTKVLTPEEWAQDCLLVSTYMYTHVCPPKHIYGHTQRHT